MHLFAVERSCGGQSAVIHACHLGGLRGGRLRLRPTTPGWGLLDSPVASYQLPRANRRKTPLTGYPACCGCCETKTKKRVRAWAWAWAWGVGVGGKGSVGGGGGQHRPAARRHRHSRRQVAGGGEPAATHPPRCCPPGGGGNRGGEGRHNAQHTGGTSEVTHEQIGSARTRAG
jgi:hypothetical protein